MSSIDLPDINLSKWKAWEPSVDIFSVILLFIGLSLCPCQMNYASNYLTLFFIVYNELWLLIDPIEKQTV